MGRMAKVVGGHRPAHMGVRAKPVGKLAGHSMCSQHTHGFETAKSP
jgi:hypothetical protein